MSEAVTVDSRPFDLARAGRAAALCIHGLTGTPYEVRPLAEALALRGIRARGPALPGHTTTPEELARVTRHDWLATVRDEVRKLRADHERVFAVGLSLGGVLSLALAQEGVVDALVPVGTPLRLRQPIPLLVPLAKRLRPIVPKREGSDIRDLTARGRHPSYTSMPLPAVHELMRLQRTVRAGLPRIRQPILVAHGVHDGTANPDDAREILATVSSSEKQLFWCESSAHVVPVDVDGPALAREAADFLASRV